MSIENRLALLNQQRLDLVSAVNSKGGSLTTDDMFPEIISGVQNLETGGGGSITDCHKVTFIDWRGDEISSIAVNHGDDLTPPDYSGDGEFAVFHSWIGDLINVTEDRRVYAQYTVLEDKTRLIIELMPGYLSPTFRFTKLSWEYPYTIDWGDGLTDSGDGGSGGFAITHNYSTPGRKIVTLINLGLGGSNSGIYEVVISGSSESMTYPYRNILKEIILKSNSPAITSDWFRYRSLYYQFGLECILLPYGMTSIGGQNSFANLGNSGSLKHLTFPTTYTGTVYWDVISIWPSLKSLCLGNLIAHENGTMSLGTGSANLLFIDIFNVGTKLPGNFGYRTGLKTIRVPEGIKSLGNQCYYLMTTDSVYIPNTVEVLGNYIFGGNPSLTRVELPSSILSIGDYFCFNCTNLSYLIFHSPTPPSITSSTFYVFALTPTIIYVPDASVDAYKAAPNWSTYASRIYPLSEYVE